jgi:Cu+-exporting ATPase
VHSHSQTDPLLPGKDGASTEFAITGMSCTNCARHVTEAIQSVSGVASATVELDASRASVHWAPGTEVDLQRVVEAVKQAGYGAVPEHADHTSEASGSPMAAWQFTVTFGAALTLPLAVGEWVFGLGMTGWFQWVGFAFSAPVMIVCGGRFFRGALEQLKRGRSNMDTLVALGSSTAFAFSVWGLLSGWHGHLYFMEAAAIVTLISAGHFVEALVSGRAASSLRALMNLAPPTARKLNSGGGEAIVPVADLRPQDTIILKPGDQVPADGAVLEGSSAVDESMLTGESLPVEKGVGAKVFSGTLNQTGQLVARVTGTGESTALAQIIAVVRRAQSSRANIQKLGDQVSSIFVPIVVLIALASALWWGLGYEHALRFGERLMAHLWPVHFPESPLAAAFIYAAAVLIVACPCAMGLATPAAIMAGTNVAAERGILIRDGIALEKSGTITAVLFDKTGTLTNGRLTVAAVEDRQNSGTRSISVKALAAALAQRSNHPISQAVSRSSELLVDTMAIENWQEVRGRGVQAELAGAVMRLGSLKWLGESGVEIEASTRFVEEWSGKGATVIGLAVGPLLVGLIALEDAIKPDADKVVRQLQRQRISVFLVTGDNRRTAAAIAEKAGIPRDNVFAEVRPEQKAEIVVQLQQRGKRVAFVGDGINDAPALETADLGIAVSKASDVAREAADIILLKADIHAVPEALGLAQATLRTIKQNLFWAFFYNAAAIPLAALGFLSPILCALSMGLSDLIVIGNAMRLRRWRG